MKEENSITEDYVKTSSDRVCQTQNNARTRRGRVCGSGKRIASSCGIAHRWVQSDSQIHRHKNQNFRVPVNSDESPSFNIKFPKAAAIVSLFDEMSGSCILLLLALLADAMASAVRASDETPSEATSVCQKQTANQNKICEVTEDGNHTMRAGSNRTCSKSGRDGGADRLIGHRRIIKNGNMRRWQVQ